jgi:ribose 5-phosphate isomerase A
MSKDESVAKMQVNAAIAALQFIEENQIIGIGTGRTVNAFITELAKIKSKIAGAVASSIATATLLHDLAIPVVDFNSVAELPLYIDGADAYNNLKQLVKGRGGALTREKILAYASEKFVCIVDATKTPSVLGEFPVAVEVIPMARSSVARALVKLGGQPQYRDKFVTDNGNIILDVYGWTIERPIELENKINQIPGVVENGIFATRIPDTILIGTEDSVKQI